MTTIHSSDLGWTAGQDISEEFAAVAKTLKPGDTFVFDHMYNISGSDIEIANNVTLKGGTPGAGFNVTDTRTNSSPLIELSDGNALVDLTVTHSNSSSDRTQKVTFKVDADDVKVLNSSFSGNTGIFLDVTGNDLLVKDTHFDGGFYQMRWLGEANNFVVDNTLFENSLGDGIKTARGGGVGTKNATIIDSVFLNNHRDGIDTTGGFKDSSVINSYFVGNGVSGMDIKTPIWEKADLSLDQTARNVTIKGSEFINNGNDIVLTTNDRAELLNDSNASQWLVQDIFISDTIFENTTSTNHAMVLAKGATGVYADNVTLLGRIQAYKEVEHNYIDHLNIDVNTNLNTSNVTTGSPRNGSLNIDYASMAGPDWTAMTDVGDGGSSTDTGDVTPDPIPDTPTDDPDPTPDVVVPPEDTTETSVSGLLDVYLAYADTDKTVMQLADGSNINSNIIDGRSMTVYAVSQDGGPDIGSVRIKVDGFGSRLENAEPYALFGDDGKGNFFGKTALPEGSYTAELIVYEGSNGSGKVLETVEFDFAVGGAAPTPDDTDPVDEPPVVVVIDPETDLEPDSNNQKPDSQLLDIQLIDSSTDKVLVDLHQGAKLSSDDFSGRKITLSAEAIDSSIANIGSVKLELDGKYVKIENVAPYALFGDNGKGNFFGGAQLADGNHTITLTTYSGKNGKGSVLEEVAVNFEVGDYDSVMIDGSLATISSYSTSQDSGTATVSNDQSAIKLEGSAWKSVDIFEEITETTTLEFDFKSDAKGEIQGIGFTNGEGELQSTFFQLYGSQNLGIQDFNGVYETGSGFSSYTIPVGQYFTGQVDQLVLVSDDDADIGVVSTFDNISLFELIA